jgi:hypothetical protein
VTLNKQSLSSVLHLGLSEGNKNNEVCRQVCNMLAHQFPTLLTSTSHDDQTCILLFYILKKTNSLATQWEAKSYLPGKVIP